MHIPHLQFASLLSSFPPHFSLTRVPFTTQRQGEGSRRFSIPTFSLGPQYRYIRKGANDKNNPVHNTLTFTLCRKHQAAHSRFPFEHCHQSHDKSVMFQKDFLILAIWLLRVPAVKCCYDKGSISYELILCIYHFALAIEVLN